MPSAAREEERLQTLEEDYLSMRPAAQTLARNYCHAFCATCLKTEKKAPSEDGA
jgi:hypothetical protein